MLKKISNQEKKSTLLVPNSKVPLSFGHFALTGPSPSKEQGLDLSLSALQVRNTFTFHKLQFYCMKNIEEYEALVHVLLKALRKKVKMLQVFGDSELVVK